MGGYVQSICSFMIVNNKKKETDNKKSKAKKKKGFVRFLCAFIGLSTFHKNTVFHDALSPCVPNLEEYVG